MPKGSLALVLVLVTFASVTSSAQSIINVPGDYADIKTAISFADHGDTILVGPGEWSGVNNRDIELFGKAITLRSTDGPGATTITGSAADRVFHIHHGEGRDTVISGFTISHGLPAGSGAYGGGLLIEDSDGGQGSSPTIRNCVIRISSASYGGGAAVRGSGYPLFDDCYFHTNDAASGGGIDIQYQAEVWNSRFYSNSAAWGGAVHIGPTQDSFKPTKFLNCRFIQNTARYGGAVDRNNARLAIFRNCLFKGNYAEMTDSSDGKGGAIYARSLECHFCTFVGNVAQRSGNTLYSDYSSVEFHNSILWDSNSNSIDATAFVAMNCDIRESALAAPGDGSFSEDPQFVVGPPGDENNYYLSPISQCVNAGNLQASAVCDIGAGPAVCLDQATTRTDLLGDTGVADIGFHYFDHHLLIFYDGFESGNTSAWE